MNTISLSSVMPDVFARRADLRSQVWQSDIKFEKGARYLIEANSGKGKSTFCSYILGYRRDYSGHLAFDGRDAQTLRVGEWVDLRQKHVSMLFQELRLFPELTAMENVLIKNALTHFKTTIQIATWFERMGIADKMDVKVGLMSFGQQQRVAFMRTLVQPFDFILADEPISHLDDDNAKIMADIMMEETTAQGAGVIVTSIGRNLPLNYDKTFEL